MSNVKYSEITNQPDDIELELFDKDSFKSTRGRRIIAEGHLHHQSIFHASLRGRHFIKQFRWSAVVSFVVGLYILGFLCVFMIFYWNQPGKPHSTGTLSLEEFNNGTYTQNVPLMEWVPYGQKEAFVKRSSDGFIMSEWGTEKSQIIAPLTIDAGEQQYTVTRVIPNKNISHALLVSASEKHWRYSSFAKYWIMDISDKSLKPLHEGKISTAAWSPNGDAIAYIFNRNLYVHDVNSATSKQITFDGGASVYNGIPNWVYEEEILKGDSATWWHPQGGYLAYMHTDDTIVAEFPIPYYLSKGHESDKIMDGDQENPESDPLLVNTKYPMPGHANPVAELWIYAAATRSSRKVHFDTELNQPIIVGVLWVGDHIVVKMSDRESDILEVWIVDAATGRATMSRAYDSEDYGKSWFQITHYSLAVGSSGYLDLIDVNGYNHLAYFSPVNASTPLILTSGEWEVQDKPMAVQEESKLVFFHANKKSSLESNIYFVCLEEPGTPLRKHPFQDAEGTYTASFSPGANFAIVAYSGDSSLLQQDIWRLPTRDGNSATHKNVLFRNDWLESLLESRRILHKGNIIYDRIDLGDGLFINYQEIRPISFNPHKRHSLLFFINGEPDTQAVQKSFHIGYQHIYAESHDAVVVTLDPRGTAGRGRAFRASVRDHLGEFETQDVLSVAKLFNQKTYIDPESVAIWGWGYGGYLALRVLERDTDLTFKYGIATAPITDWTLYDSFFTERLMHSPKHNPNGYHMSNVRNLTSLARHNRFLLIHGTGDDNVHFQNTLTFLNELLLSGVENYDLRVFPNSDHSLRFHTEIVHSVVDRWLRENQTNRRRNGLRS